VVHAPQVCGGCGVDLGGAEVAGQIRRQVFDLPEIRLRVVEHRVQRRVCGCGAVTAAGFPAGVSALACYGPGVRAAIAYLCVAQHLPIERASQTLSDLLARRSLLARSRMSSPRPLMRPVPAVQAIAAQVVAAQVGHFDETGARVAGRGHWVHCASTPTLSHCTVHPKRGKEAMDAAGVLSAFKRRGGARRLAVLPRLRADQPWAVQRHHLRELAAIAEQAEHQDWAGYLIDTLVAAHRAVSGPTPTATSSCRPGWSQRSRRAIWATSRKAARPTRVTRTARKQTDAFNLLERLAGYVDDVLRFTVDFRVPSTTTRPKGT
jgi:transposase